jgi:hypothetical protein
MIITFTVAADMKFSGGGPFASREDLTQQIQEALDEANPEELDAEEGATYEVTSWQVTAN